MAPDLLHHDPRGLVERGESREVRPSHPANPFECRTWLRRRLGVTAIVRFATAGVLAVAASGFAAAQNAADVGPASGPLVGGSDPQLTATSADPGAIWQPTPGGPGSSEKPLEILLAPRPPFAFKDELGQWDGLSISLWREIAERLQIEFVLVETTLEQVVRAVREGTGSTIIGVAITPERAKSSFLTHAFESSGVGIATRERIGLLPSVSASLEWMEVLQLLLLLILLFFIAAVLIWICERRHEVRHFHPKASRGIPDGMWWSVVTFATIGYGDKVPQTIAGRIVAATWILFSVVLVALFTGIIASRITLTAGAYVVTGADDLGHKRVGAVDGTLTSTILRRMGVPFERFESDPDGVDALAQGRLDAFISDYAVLHYYVEPLRERGLRVLPHPIARDFIALSFSRSLPSNLLEAIDVAMLQEIATPDWTWVRHRYLGLLITTGEEDPEA
ncbi:MAG: Glutamine-binding periplasmic protein precursor [Planctomycetota bacterium]